MAIDPHIVSLILGIIMLFVGLEVCRPFLGPLGQYAPRSWPRWTAGFIGAVLSLLWWLVRLVTAIASSTTGRLVRRRRNR